MQSQTIPVERNLAKLSRHSLFNLAIPLEVHPKDKMVKIQKFMCKAIHYRLSCKYKSPLTLPTIGVVEYIIYLYHGIIHSHNKE